MNQNTNKKKNGCLWFFILSVLSFFNFVIIKAVFLFSTSISIFISVVISFIFLAMILGKFHLKTLIRSGVIIFLLFFGLKFIGNFLLVVLKTTHREKTVFNLDEKIIKSSVIEENDTIPLYASNRNWKDNYGNSYNAILSVRERDYLRLKNHIKSYKPPIRGYFWGNLYDYIDRKDAPSLDLIMEAFTKINLQYNLNRMEFAEMIVSCIQDIPYSLVFIGECKSAENYEKSIKNLLEDCPECCIGNIKYGIQNPVSFIQNLKGDCDTRTVLLYSILKHFKYDIAIVNSEYYQHSILGINLPASGLYKIHNGKKYILWETTAKYFKLGHLSPSFNNVTHWNVILTSK